MDSAQVTAEQVHPDLLQDSQVHESHESEASRQVQVSYLEVGRFRLKKVLGSPCRGAACWTGKSDASGSTN